MDKVIDLKNACKSYRMGSVIVDALRGVSLNVSPGEFIAIMGPSGSGKSTLMHVLGLLDRPDSGVLCIAGKDLAEIPDQDMAALRSKTVGFVFQQFHLLPRMSALENVELPLIYAGKRHLKERARENLELVGLADRANHNPNELSGGQQQRVAIARAIVNDPMIILADEPTGNLDSKSKDEIIGVLKELNDAGKTVIIVTHEPEIASHAKRAIKMCDGKIISDETKVKSEKRIVEDAPRENSRNDAPRGKPRGIRCILPLEGGGEGDHCHPLPIPLPSLRLRSGQAREREWAVTPPHQPEADPPLAEAAGNYLVADDGFSGIKFFDYLRQAIFSMLSHKLRSILSILGVLIGVGAVVAMLALGQGAKKSIESQLSSLGSNLLMVRPGSARLHNVSMQTGEVTRFTMKDVAEIAKLSDYVKDVSPSISGRAQLVYADKNWNTQVEGVGVEYERLRASAPIEGRFFTEDEVRRREKVVLVGMTVVKEIFDGNDPIGKLMKVNLVNFRVIGVLPPRGASSWRDQDDVIVMPVTTAMDRVFGKDYLDMIYVEANSAENLKDAEEAISSLIIKEHRLVTKDQKDSFQIRNMSDIRATLEATTKTMSLLLGAIAVISLIVGGIGIMNITLVSVTERTREIGLRKAIGAKEKDIMIQFLCESTLMSLIGGALGILAGFAISFLMILFAGWTVSVSLFSILLATLFSFAVGVIFGIWPAYQAARLNPIEALRYE